MSPAVTDRLLDAVAGLRVVVLGDPMLDVYVEGASTRLTPEAPVPVVDVDRDRPVAGGAANTAVNAAALGASVRLVGLVGADEPARRLTRLLHEAGIEVDGLVVDPDRATLTRMRVLADGQLLVRLDAGATHPPPADIGMHVWHALEHALADCDLLLLSDYGYGTVSDELLGRLEQRVARSRDTGRAAPRPMLAADAKDLRRHRSLRPAAVKPNHAQAAVLGGLSKATGSERIGSVLASEAALRAAVAADVIAVTLDRDGAVVFGGPGSAPVHVPATPTSDANAAGAGDTYFAALALALAAGADHVVAAQLAATAAAVVVRSPLTTACVAGDLRRRLASQAKLVAGVEELERRLAAHRARGEQVVLTNGCFDILHVGHVAYLAAARALGDVLVVALNTDAGVRRHKGAGRPVNELGDRCRVVAGLQSVDYVIAFDEPTPVELVRAIRPAVFAKGGDYERAQLPEAAVVEQLGGRVQILGYETDRSTTATIARIRGSSPAPPPPVSA